MRHQCLTLARLRSPRVGQNSRHLGVGKARLTEHDCRVKLVGVYFAFGCHQHVAHHAQALHIRVERTQTIGELFGQHGNHTTREIHTGGPVVGVNVNGAAGLHIVAHVGNRHQ